MHPHPPASGRTRNIPNIKSRTYRNFPGMGDTLRSPNNQNKKDAPKPSSKKKEAAVSLSPLRSVCGLKIKNNPDMEMCSNNKTGPGTSKKNIPNLNRSSNEYLERSDSFSKYKLLPAISDKKEIKGSKNKISNKRTFETWTTENKNIENKTNSEKDDALLDTIKRMKLGNDGLISSERSYLPNNKIQSKITKNPFDRDKVKEINKADNIPSTSSIDLIIRLPDGERIQHSFSSSDTLTTMVEYLSNIMKKKIDLKTYVLYTNEVPKRELKSRKSTIVALGIQDKSVLALDTRDFPDRN